jgi:hypothetical protein
MVALMRCERGTGATASRCCWYLDRDGGIAAVRYQGQCRSAEIVACNSDVQWNKPASCLVDISPPSEVCISNKDSRTATRSAGKGQGMCTYTCAHHPELVDSGLWRRLPQELVEAYIGKTTFASYL